VQRGVGTVGRHYRTCMHMYTMWIYKFLGRKATKSSKYFGGKFVFTKLNFRASANVLCFGCGGVDGVQRGEFGHKCCVWAGGFNGVLRGAREVGRHYRTCMHMYIMWIYKFFWEKY